jgi:hypothetical protein
MVRVLLCRSNLTLNAVSDAHEQLSWNDQVLRCWVKPGR